MHFNALHRRHVCRFAHALGGCALARTLNLALRVRRSSRTKALRRPFFAARAAPFLVLGGHAAFVAQFAKIGDNEQAPTTARRPECVSFPLETTMTASAPPSPPSSPSSEDGDVDPRFVEFARQVFDAARRGEAATLATLIDQGMPPNLRNEKGDSLVMLASYYGHADAVRALVQRGADPDLRNDNGQTPLAGAAFKGYADVIAALLENGADVEGASPDGRTALMIAAMFNRTDIVDLLLARGASPAAHDAAGNTALDVANAMGAADAAARLAPKTGGHGT